MGLYQYFWGQNQYSVFLSQFQYKILMNQYSWRHWNSQEGVVTTLCEGHTVVLDSVSINQFSELTFNSSLNVTLEENVTVTCGSGVGSESVTLRVASKRAETGTH